MNTTNNNTGKEIWQMTESSRLLELFRTVPVLSVQYINHKLALNSPRKVISDLRRKGYDIKDRWAEHIRPDGSTVRYKEYWLVPCGTPMCFDCKHQNIMTIQNDVKCKCAADFNWHNPYRPMVLPDRDCPNWELARKEDGNAEIVRN